MKAKDLIVLLEKHPNAEVVFEEYQGGLTPIVKVWDATFFPKKAKSPIYDDGDCVGPAHKLTEDIILISSHLASK